MRAIAYDEGANKTQDYQIVAMIEPKSALLDPDELYSPVRWPSKVTREEGMEGPLVMWGEEFELPKMSAATAGPLLTSYGQLLTYPGGALPDYADLTHGKVLQAQSKVYFWQHLFQNQAIDKTDLA